jgi:peroxiredoxin family protein
LKEKVISVSDVTSSGNSVSAESLVERLTALETRLEALEESQPDDKVAIIVFSGELDKVIAAFIIATGAAALGQEVSMFFTFWGLSVLKKRNRLADKNIFEKMMAVMSPGNSEELPVSQMNYFGVGAKMLRKMMKDKNVSSLEEMMAMAKELDVKLLACEMSRDLMAVSDEELMDGLEPAGVASFLGESLRSRTNLFI